MMACAADEIVMGKHSAISPIDPQMTINGAGATVPAHTILKDFDTARADVAANPLLANLWAPRLVHLPPGILNLCTQITQLSELKVRTWLSEYMLKGDQKKAGEIAAWLANFEEHKTHGRPIGIELARSKGLVYALEDNQPLQEAVLPVFHVTMVTFQATSCLKVIENHLAKGHYVVRDIAPQQQLRP